jgi:CDP-glucose 4,6-dehydratase
MVIDANFWRDRRVFITGHTGFKGAWISLVLRSLGAEVFGFALAPENRYDLFNVANIEQDVHHRLSDVRDPIAVETAMAESEADVVFHMAAQSLVRRSYAEPVLTYATNVMGTVHVLEAVRRTPSVRAAVIVTSDKCYENVGSTGGCRETDALGGRDPYSSSKGCAEIVTAAYRRSFFHSGDETRVASVRAGNVIGGGDWAQDRLVPDAMRAFIEGQPLRIRNPHAVRPWQHVLDPVAAYLLVAERLLVDGGSAAEAWNFGPSAASEVSVATIADRVVRLWGAGASWQKDGNEHPHEAAELRLDCSKAAGRFGWRPLLDLEQSLQLTVDWYKAIGRNADMRSFTLAQINRVLSGQSHDRPKRTKISSQAHARSP